MKLAIGMVAFFAVVGVAVSQAQAASDRESCRAAAVRSLGTGAEVLRTGDFVRAGYIQCLAVVSISSNGTGRKVRSGVVMERNGIRWTELLKFNKAIRNPHGYVGIDFLDDEPKFGFLVQTAEKRSDETNGFTLYLTWLDPQLSPEGVAVQIGWNPKANRFQEYAPNELDPPDFKPDLPHPPKRKR